MEPYGFAEPLLRNTALSEGKGTGYESVAGISWLRIWSIAELSPIIMVKRYCVHCNEHLAIIKYWNFLSDLANANLALLLEVCVLFSDALKRHGDR